MQYQINSETWPGSTGGTYYYTVCPLIVHTTAQNPTGTKARRVGRASVLFCTAPPTTSLLNKYTFNKFSMILFCSMSCHSHETTVARKKTFKVHHLPSP